jgi:ABC-type cobalamin/Fe3+-siderophores transport system ATPase subunit
MTPTISTTALGRRYRGQVALDNVSLTVEPGTVTGLLGRNGAGKTTLMRIVTGQEFPTSGAVRVFGEAPAENDAVLRRMVFVREEQAYPDIRVCHAGRARRRRPRHRHDGERAGHGRGGVRGGPPGLAPAAARLGGLTTIRRVTI